VEEKQGGLFSERMVQFKGKQGQANCGEKHWSHQTIPMLAASLEAGSLSSP
jgi:hypothetical protein